MNIKQEPNWNSNFLSDDENALSSDDEIFVYLMELWGLQSMIEDWKSRYIDLECLTIITDEDINILLPVEKLGLRIKFKRNLKLWRIENGYPDPNLTPPPFNSVDPLDMPIVPIVSINHQRRKKSHQQIKVADDESFSLGNFSSNTEHLVVHNSRKVTKLDYILHESKKGVEVLKYFNEHDFKLDNSNRNSLISTIIDYHVRMSEGMSAAHFDFYAIQITETFPNESYETYYISATPTNKAGGKLINKYYNVSKTLKLGLKRGKPAGHSNSKKPKINQVVKSIVPQIPTDLNNISIEQNWLMKNTGPWNEVIENWTNSFSVRKKQYFNNNEKTVDQILLDWPVLSDEKSHQLINMDFSVIHPEKSHLLYQKWENFTLKLTNYYTSSAHTKDPEYRKLIDSIKTNITEDSKNCILTVCLSYIPLAKIKMKTEKYSTISSTEEIRNSFITIVENSAQLDEKLKSWKTMCQLKGFKIHPLIFAIGKDFTQINEYIVVFDELRYTFYNFTEALDMCFKIHHVFYIEYSVESYWIWRFIQSYFYEMESSDVRSCVLSSFISDFL